MSSQDKFLYEQQEERLSQQSKHLVEYLQSTGILEDTSIDNAKIRKKRQEMNRKQYHNTQLLLEQYRLILWVLECVPTELPQELSLKTKNLDDLIQKIDIELSLGNRKLENRLASIVKTRFLVECIQDALAILRKRPDTGEKLYQIIYYTYIDSVKYTVLELLAKLEMSERTYYRMRQEAIHIISIRLWSSPSADVDTWLEVLSFIQSF